MYKRMVFAQLRFWCRFGYGFRWYFRWMQRQYERNFWRTWWLNMAFSLASTLGLMFVANRLNELQMRELRLVPRTLSEYPPRCPQPHQFATETPCRLTLVNGHCPIHGQQAPQHA